MSAEKNDFAEWLKGFDGYTSRQIAEACESFTISQRVAIAERVREQIRQRRETLRTAKRKAKAGIRARTPKGEQEPCFICDGCRPITVRHHVKPVAISDPDDPESLRTVWLCPNCHTILHKALRKEPITREFADLLSPAEWLRADLAGGDSR